MVHDTTLDEYFFHNGKSFTIDCTLNISLFFKKVLQEDSLIKFGEVQSYKQIAKSLKRKKAFRAVANANANNPIPIIISYHRVIKSSGEGALDFIVDTRNENIKLLASTLVLDSTEGEVK
ncbi:MAG: hypothetical protein CMF94_02845, partial [Candidatus Marinimicrobia bacterium]|nr:hypothetical protein [Candidatus Neomarinimicrobiota bacterium]